MPDTTEFSNFFEKVKDSYLESLNAISLSVENANEVRSRWFENIERRFFEREMSDIDNHLRVFTDFLDVCKKGVIYLQSIKSSDLNFKRNSPNEDFNNLVEKFNLLIIFNKDSTSKMKELADLMGLMQDMQEYIYNYKLTSFEQAYLFPELRSLADDIDEKIFNLNLWTQNLSMQLGKIKERHSPFGNFIDRLDFKSKQNDES